MPAYQPIHGVLVLDKPAGPTSHDMVVELRRIFSGSKVGHIGTLDPFATGVLPLCVGKATRLAQYLGEGSKTYEAEIRFGFATETGDWTGKPVSEPVSVQLQSGQVEALLARFDGTFLQKPPLFSAQKIRGVPLYRYARQGKPVEAVPREVTVYEISVIRWENSRCWLHIQCSPGTYIRSIAADLGAALGCGAHLGSLRRTQAGEFGLSHAVDSAWFGQDVDRERLVQRVIPMESLLSGFPKLVLDEEGVRRIGHGAAVRSSHVEDLHEWAGLQAGSVPPTVRLFSPAGQLAAVARAESALPAPSLVSPGGLTDVIFRPLTVLL